MRGAKCCIMRTTGQMGYGEEFKAADKANL